jgi:hypothetical protein
MAGQIGQVAGRGVQYELLFSLNSGRLQVTCEERTRIFGQIPIKYSVAHGLNMLDQKMNVMNAEQRTTQDFFGAYQVA